MKALLTVGMLLVASVSGAQKYSAPFGEMPEAELREALTMTTYDAEPGTEAIALYRSVQVEVTDFGTKLTYLFRTKVFNSTAFEKWSDATINVRSEGLTTIKGNSYSLVNGQVIKRSLDEPNIHKKKLNHAWDSYTMTMPNVHEGSIIEYSYVTLVQFWWLPSWDFQLDIPCLHSEYFLKNRDVGFRTDITGQLEVSYEEVKKKQTHRWHVDNIASFKEEPFMPNPDLFKSSLKLWLYERPWKENTDVVYWRKAFYALPVSQASTLREKTSKLTETCAGQQEKVKVIVDYVKRNVEWNEGDEIMASDFNDVLREKTGNAADVNLLLTAMLLKAGINASPVLLSTRDNGHYHEDIPTLLQFNYTVAQAVIGNDTLYLDATEKNLQYDALPVRCLNGRGLMIGRDGTQWVDISPRYKRKIQAEGNFTIDAAGEMKGQISVIRDGYEAYDSREDLARLGEDYFKDRVSNWHVEKKDFQNQQSAELSLIESYNVMVSDHVSVAGQRMYVNPYVLPYPATNPFKADSRLYPVEFDAPIEATLLYNIILPEGFEVEELPQSRVIALPGNAARAIFNISSEGGKVQVMTRLQINRTLFMPEEYGQLKEFYTRLFAKQGEQIVILKK
ncbi:MAG TPA: transglutaminase domain-containing protein [Cyclobacteriaceae bacterium]|nr:transglutaminase domain-containing protein [Cyclobacteriaceae bacterium]